MTFTLRPAAEADFPRIVQIINTQANEPTTLEEYQRQNAIRPTEVPILRLVGLTPDGAVAGFGTATTGPFHRSGEVRISLRVEASFGRQGLGKQLYEALERWGREQGGTFLEGMLKEDDGDSIAWAERRGCRKLHHLFKSTLTLENFDPDPYMGPLERARAEGLRVISLAELPADEGTYRELHAFYEETGRDIPGMEDSPEIPFEFFKQAVVESPKFHPPAIHLVLDGDRWAATSQMVPQKNGSYYHQYTGVRQEYRGRGLATAVKMAAIQWAMANGVPALQTHNHSANQRMLAVNRKMGYLPEPGTYVVRKELSSPTA